VGTVLWDALASRRLTLATFWALIGLSVLGTLVAQEGVPGAGVATLYSPETLYWLRLLGFTDIFHGGWFALALIVFGVNLVCATIQGWSAIWRQVSQAVPAAVSLEQVTSSRRAEKYLYVSFPSTLGREAFREVVNDWARGKIGRPHTVRDEGGLEELQLVAQRGRYTRVFAIFAHLSLLVIIAGAILSGFRGFDARMTVDEGTIGGFAEVTRGQEPLWTPLLEKGRAVEGFFVPPFEVACSKLEVAFWPGTSKPRSVRSWLQFSEDGKTVSKEVSVNQPVTFGGFTFRQAGWARTGALAALISVTDRLAAKGTEPRRISLAAQEQEQLDPGDGKSGPTVVRVLEIQPTTPDYGPAVRLEVRAPGKALDAFWVFRDYPDFASSLRRSSRYHFELGPFKERLSTSLAISRDPGMPLALGGFALLALTVIASLLRSHERYWFVWQPGKVSVIAWSSRLFLFEPRFERALENFRKRMARLDRGLKGTHLEVQHGSL
jgi:cytochrome c biogenesis protein ResB